MPVFDDQLPSLSLSPAQSQELEDVVRARNGRPATILRAQIILHRAAGHTPGDTAKVLGISRQKVQQWERRYRHHGIAGLNEARDRGRSTTILNGRPPPPAPLSPGPALRSPGRVSPWQRLRNKFAASSVLRAMVHGFFTVAGLTLLAKAVSFFKDADIVRRFGISDDLDAFALAFGIHTFTSGMLGGGIPNAFLPAYAVLQHEHGPLRAERLAIQSALSHALSLLIIGAFIYLLGPQIVSFLSHGFPLPKQQLSLHLLRALLPFLFCYGLSLHLSMWLRANKLFVFAAAAPVLTPAAILAALALHSSGPVSVETLVAGTNIGGGLQLLVLCATLAQRLPRERGWLTGCCAVIEPANRATITNAIPFVISGLVLGGAPMIDQAMAAQLESGSVTVLSYADKVCGIILALTASAAAEALFPFFADVVARRNWLALKRQLLHTIGVILAVAVPLVALLVWQAPLVVRLLFERGSFVEGDTGRVAAVLRCAALQIPFYIASLLMSKVVIALQANWFTLATAVFSLAGNFVFNIVLMRYYGVAGIALSTAVVYALSTFILCAYLMRTVARLTVQDAERSLAA